MSGILERLSGRGERSSAKTAKDRLVVVLNHDRSGIGPGLLETIKEEIIRALSRHIEVDPTSVEIHLFTEGREQHLKADIPLSPASRRRPPLG